MEGPKIVGSGVKKMTVEILRVQISHNLERNIWILAVHSVSNKIGFSVYLEESRQNHPGLWLSGC